MSIQTKSKKVKTKPRKLQAVVGVRRRRVGVWIEAAIEKNLNRIAKANGVTRSRFLSSLVEDYVRAVSARP
jgi:hypothetical protein